MNRMNPSSQKKHHHYFARAVAWVLSIKEQLIIAREIPKFRFSGAKRPFHNTYSGLHYFLCLLFADKIYHPIHY